MKPLLRHPKPEKPIKLKGKAKKKLRRDCAERYGYICQYCKQPAPWDGPFYIKGDMCHIKHGHDVLSNVFWAHHTCHIEQGHMKGKLPDLLESHDKENGFIGGIMEKEFYYYLRDRNNRPVVTVCLLKANGDVSRGVAICSFRDFPCKKTGRKIAKTRATHAMKCRKATGRIDRTRARGVVASTDNFNLFNKSEFRPDLFNFELKILEASVR